VVAAAGGCGGLVLFGATGDLARRKLLQRLFHLFAAGLLPDNYRIIGSARRALTDEQFREHARQSVAEFGIIKPAGAKDTPAGRRNEIVIDFADPGSITVEFLAKEPGAEMRLGTATMAFRYQDSFCAASGLEGHERLILDAMLGDQTLFTRADGVERWWEISAPPWTARPQPSPTPRGRGVLSRRSAGWPPHSAGTLPDAGGVPIRHAASRERTSSAAALSRSAVEGPLRDAIPDQRR